MTYRNKKISLFIIISIFIGCTPAYHNKNTYLIKPIEKRDILTSNKIYQHEPWAKEKKRPILGIALSGGGSKAAPFSMGVLKQFVDRGWLKDVDIISSVSGGGYSAYYLYSKAIYIQEHPSEALKIKDFFKNCALEPCFEDDGIYQKYVKDYQDLFSLSKSELSWKDSHKDEVDASLAVFGGFFSSLLFAPLHHISNTLFDWKVELAPTQYTYLNGLIRTYGIVPSEHNNSNDFNAYNHQDNRQIFKSLHTLIEQGKVPLWIVNSSNFEKFWFKEFSKDKKQNLDNSIFELTPYGFGSGKYGYAVDDLSNLGIDIPRAILSSAAFLDASKEQPAQELAFIGLHLFNFRWGIKIPNYTTTVNHQNLHNLLPFPFYYLDMKASKITLADGGQSGDNLGLYSLIKRGTKNIVIVSGAYDLNPFNKTGMLKMKNMCTVSQFLKDKNLTVQFKGRPDVDSSEELLNFYDNFCAEDGKYYQKIAFYQWEKPIWKGFVYKDGEEISKLFFIKAAIDRENILDSSKTKYSHDYPPFMLKFIKDNKEEKDASSFPQTTTFITTLNNSQDLYQAYMDLGFYLSGYLVEDKAFINSLD